MKYIEYSVFRVQIKEYSGGGGGRRLLTPLYLLDNLHSTSVSVTTLRLSKREDQDEMAQNVAFDQGMCMHRLLRTS